MATNLKVFSLSHSWMMGGYYKHRKNCSKNKTINSNNCGFPLYLLYLAAFLLNKNDTLVVNMIKEKQWVGGETGAVMVGMYNMTIKVDL